MATSSTETLVHELGSILQAILQPSDAIRKTAESQLETLISDGSRTGETLYGLSLIGQGAGGYPNEIRSLALVLLRRQAFKVIPGPPADAANGGGQSAAGQTTTPFDLISEQAREKVEGCLIAGLENEMDAKIRKGLADVVAKWVEESAKRGREWKDHAARHFRPVLRSGS